MYCSIWKLVAVSVAAKIFVLLLIILYFHADIVGNTRYLQVEGSD